MRKLAINQLRDNPALSPEVVTQFVDKHRSPIIEGQRPATCRRDRASSINWRRGGASTTNASMIP